MAMDRATSQALVLLAFLIPLCSNVLVQGQLPIPAKIDGFVYKQASVWGHSVIVEAFFDPLCPDSRDSWPPLKKALEHYSPRVSLVVHPFPLPYHSNSFVACRALHIANKLNSSSTYPLLELFFKHQYACSRAVTGTPSFFVNGMPLFDSNMDYKKWISIIDPLLPKKL